MRFYVYCFLVGLSMVVMIGCSWEDTSEVATQTQQNENSEISTLSNVENVPTQTANFAINTQSNIENMPTQTIPNSTQFATQNQTDIVALPQDPEWVCFEPLSQPDMPRISTSSLWQPVPSVMIRKKNSPDGSSSLSSQANSNSYATNYNTSSTPQLTSLTHLPATTQSDTIRILYWGAMDGTLLPSDTNNIAQAPYLYLSSLIAKRRLPNTIVCSTGDLFSGEEQNDLPMMKALELLGLEIMALSNLELNYGVSKIKDKLSKAKFITLSANVYEDQTRLFPAYHIKEMAGVKVAFIGITTEEAAIQVSPDKIQGITFQDTIQEVQDCLDELADKADIFILMSNLRHDRDLELAKACPQLHAIIGRYDVDKNHLVTQEGTVCITRIYHKLGTEIGELDIQKQDNIWVVQSPKIYSLLAEKPVEPLPDYVIFARDTLTPSAEAIAFLKQCQDEQKEFSEVLAHTATKLEGEYQMIRQNETNLGNLIADIILESGNNANIAVINSGCIRASIPQGDITRGMLLTSLPYNNKLVQIEVSGETIQEILENSVAQYEKVSGAFLQVAGISFCFDPSKPKFNRVDNILVQGEALNLHATYKLVTVSYLATGGDDYVMLKDKPAQELPLQLQQAVEQYLKKQKNIQTSCEGRIIKTE